MRKLEIDIEKIRCKIQEETLQEDFINKLEEKLNNKYEEIKLEEKTKKSSKNFSLYKVAAVFICVLVVSSFAFADQIENIFRQVTANVDKELDIAYEEGKYSKIDSEYQQFDGVSINVDSVLINDNKMFIVFNVEANTEFSEVYFNDIKLTSIDDIELSNDTNYKCDINKSNKNNAVFIAKYEKIGGNFEQLNTINLKINTIKLKVNKKFNTRNGNWDFEINYNEKG